MCISNVVPRQGASGCVQYESIHEKPSHSMCAEARVYHNTDGKLGPGYQPSALLPTPFFLEKPSQRFGSIVADSKAAAMLPVVGSSLRTGHRQSKKSDYWRMRAEVQAYCGSGQKLKRFSPLCAPPDPTGELPSVAPWLSLWLWRGQIILKCPLERGAIFP